MQQEAEVEHVPYLAAYQCPRCKIICKTGTDKTIIDACIAEHEQATIDFIARLAGERELNPSSHAGLPCYTELHNACTSTVMTDHTRRLLHCWHDTRYNTHNGKQQECCWDGHLRWREDGYLEGHGRHVRTVVDYKDEACNYSVEMRQWQRHAHE